MPCPAARRLGRSAARRTGPVRLDRRPNRGCAIAWEEVIAARVASSAAYDRQLRQSGGEEEGGGETSVILGLAEEWAGARTLPADQVDARALPAARSDAAALPIVGGTWSELTNV